ncbi:permease prefix domain 1-containing protein [Breznakia sp. OttesenSCG-928-G09]|nr:permease prefix domain 1-containing protein [Breznakia sp. OttesenSCG-928-G09]
METIRAYIDQMFKDLPKTKEVVEMKLNIQDHMEEKFQELIDEGINEAEASKRVINEFGDMDEILKELDIDPNKENQEEINYLSDKEIEKYVQWKRAFMIMIAVGVMLCINAVGISSMLSDIIPGKFGDIITGIAFFGLVAVAVIIFIIFGMRAEYYDAMVKDAVIDSSKKVELQKRYLDAKKKQALPIALGVLLCIISVAIYPLVEFILTDGIAGFVFFFIISVAVAMFITSSSSTEAYEVFIDEKKRVGSNGTTREKEDGAIHGVIMLSATAIYLVLGFLLHWWHPGWIIFPLAGILCGIVEVTRKDR